MHVHLSKHVKGIFFAHRTKIVVEMWNTQEKMVFPPHLSPATQLPKAPKRWEVSTVDMEPLLKISGTQSMELLGVPHSPATRNTVQGWGNEVPAGYFSHAGKLDCTYPLPPWAAMKKESSNSHHILLRQYIMALYCKRSSTSTGTDRIYHFLLPLTVPWIQATEI